MKKYIYKDNSLRCRLKTTAKNNQIELQIQKRFGIFWFDVYKWMHVSEEHLGECERIPVIKMSYAYGNNCEFYMKGTLDIKKRVSDFFTEYDEHLADKQKSNIKIMECI